MRSTLFSLAALPLASYALEFLDDNKFQQESDMLRFPIAVSGGAPSRNIQKRQNDVSIRSQKTGFFYTIEIMFGTPPKPVSVNFDTGSSELWVNPVCSKSTDPTFCENFGRFAESQTFIDANATGGVKYGTGFVDFEYGYDYVQIGSARVKQQMFGVATDSEFASVGILGAGPSLKGWNSPYPFVIDSMAQQGLIKSRAFSLDIRSIGSDRGSVVFGGIDTKKFSGKLEKRPIIDPSNSPDGQTRYWIYLDGITVTKEDGNTVPVFDKPNGQAVLLDSGYTISTLPGPIFNEILKAFPSAKKSPDSDEYLVDCNIGKTTGHVNFKFGKTVINVPYDDFIWKQPDHGLCKLGVAQDDKFPVLGDTFLRAAYVVYDWDNQNIHLANNEDCGSNLLAIGKGPDAVPSVAGDCGVSATASIPASTFTTAPTAPANVTGGSGNSTHAPATTHAAVTTGWYNITSAPPTLTSTITSTNVYTITSCAPTVTNCPVGKVTTEVVTSYTTYCPAETTTAVPWPTTTPADDCPEITATYTIPRTYTCSKGKTSCEPQTTVNVVTIVPIVTMTVPIKVPYCTTCAPVVPSSTAAVSTPVLINTPGSTPVAPPPMVTSPPEAVTSPSGGIVTVTTPCLNCGPVSTQPGLPPSGASEMFRAPGMAILALCVLVAAVM